MDHRNGTVTWEQLTQLCTTYARSRAALQESSEEIREAQRAAAKSGLKALKRRADAMTNASEKLRRAVSQANSQGMFQSPRTKVIDGIRVGVHKKPGVVEVSDEAIAIARIRATLSDRVDQLVRIRESLDRTAIRHLSAEELAVIGVRIVDGGEEIVARPVGTDALEGWVEMLLADAGREDAA